MHTSKAESVRLAECATVFINRDAYKDELQTQEKEQDWMSITMGCNCNRSEEVMDDDHYAKRELQKGGGEKDEEHVFIIKSRNL